MDAMIEKIKNEYGEVGAKVVYYEKNELGVVFAAVLGESGTVYHVNAYGAVSDYYEATPVTM